jgi:serine/threonine protein kinase
MGTGAQHVLRGRFEVLEEIGEGGFARVYSARETTTGQRVALKVLKDGFQNDKEVMERFRREVFAVASINSPHVVGLKDFGISGDEFFIAMEFVEGPTLRDVIDQHDWSADSVHTIIGQVASALEAAHEQTIVHRDLKPENVMIVSGPNDTMLVKVLDFGLAKLADLERNLGLAPLTRVGMCFGTPQYMSPELIYGKPVDRSVDLFALGVMTYEMIAGRRPWDGSQPQEVMVAVVKTPLQPILSTHPSMARRLDHINRFLARALAKKKDERPPDAAEFLGELSEAIYGERRQVTTPAFRDAPAELSAIHTRLPANRPRADETQIDMNPATRMDMSAEKTVEFQAIPRHERPERPVTPQPDGAADTVINQTGRSGRLSSVWIPSIPSSPSLEEPLEPLEPPTPSHLSNDHTETTKRRGSNGFGAQVTAPSMPIDTQSYPVAQKPRSRWVVFALVGGLVILMVVAAAVGFLIGRGH